MMLAPAGVMGLVVTFIALSAALVGDTIQTAKPDVAESKLVALARVSPIIFAVVALILALYPTGIIVEIVGAAFGTIFACFVGPVAIGLYWKGATKTGALASIIGGLVMGLGWYLVVYKELMFGALAWVYPVIPALVVAVPLFFIVSLVTLKPPKEVIEILG